jgi:hypothetical protein
MLGRSSGLVRRGRGRGQARGCEGAAKRQNLSNRQPAAAGPAFQIYALIRACITQSSDIFKRGVVGNMAAACLYNVHVLDIPYIQDVVLSVHVH